MRAVWPAHTFVLVFLFWYLWKHKSYRPSLRTNLTAHHYAQIIPPIITHKSYRPPLRTNYTAHHYAVSSPLSCLYLPQSQIVSSQFCSHVDEILGCTKWGEISWLTEETLASACMELANSWRSQLKVRPQSVTPAAPAFFFFFHVQGPDRMLRIHCSLKTYCARPIQYYVPTFVARCLSASYTTRELQAAKGGTICGWETWPVILPRDADFHDTF